jgi:hypothetical protein
LTDDKLFTKEWTEELLTPDLSEKVGDTQAEGREKEDEEEEREGGK